MVQDADRFAMDLIRALERLLQGKVKLMITQCSMRHLYSLSSLPQPQKDALILRAKNMERRRCNHHTLDQPLSTLECLSSVIDPKNSRTNKNRYIIASQSEESRRQCREIKGVPLVYIKRSVMVMEPMAEASLGAREGFEKGKFRAGIRGKIPAVSLKRKRQDERNGTENDDAQGNDAFDAVAELNEAQKSRKKLRGPKGPNPLSMQKSRRAKEIMQVNAKNEAPKSLVINDANEEWNSTQHEPNIIQRSRDQDHDSPAKRKRKRKHKIKGLEELKSSLRENGDEGGISS
ncbi:MAG: hypothetical protein Q9195_003136 [Heterodermia aff. obscurata]